MSPTFPPSKPQRSTTTDRPSHLRETLIAKDKYLAQALWELSERIIKDKVGPDALTSWDR